MSILRRKAGERPFSANEPVDEHRLDFPTFYQENLSLIYRYVYNKVRNREEAEDLTSQIFLKAVNGMQMERSTLSAQKWLFQVARTTIADYWRLHYRTVSTTSLEELQEKGWEGPGERAEEDAPTTPIERVQHLLLALPDQYREVLNCRFLLKLSIRETAQKMGITEVNVKVLQFRALKRASEIEERASKTI